MLNTLKNLFTRKSYNEELEKRIRSLIRLNTELQEVIIKLNQQSDTHLMDLNKTIVEKNEIIKRLKTEKNSKGQKTITVKPITPVPAVSTPPDFTKAINIQIEKEEKPVRIHKDGVEELSAMDEVVREEPRISNLGTLPIIDGKEVLINKDKGKQLQELYAEALNPVFKNLDQKLKMTIGRHRVYTLYGQSVDIASIVSLFISRNKKMPPSTIDVYGYLITQLKTHSNKLELKLRHKKIIEELKLGQHTTCKYDQTTIVTKSVEALHEVGLIKYASLSNTKQGASASYSLPTYASN